MITPEKIYNEYHKQSFYFNKGFYPRSIKNFDKYIASPEWVYIEKFTRMVNDSAGQIDPELYIKSLVEFYEGRFPLKLLSHPKSIKIYKTKIELMNCTDDKKMIEEQVLSSIRYVVSYCKDKQIKDFNEYLFENCELIPTPLKHYKSGSISIHFMVLIPGIQYILNQYPADVIRDYMKDFKNEYDTIRSKVIHQEKLRKIGDNLTKIIDNLIKKHSN